MKLPQLIVFAKAFVIGFIGTELFRIFFAIGTKFVTSTGILNLSVVLATILVSIAVVITYAVARGAIASTTRIVKSSRVDLLLAVLTGAWANVLALSCPLPFYKSFQAVSPMWAPLALVVLVLVLISSLIRSYWPVGRSTSQFVFLEDIEIDSPDQDALGVSSQASAFADAVLASAPHSGLVFGVEGPWGVGKSSFIRLAECSWKDRAPDKVIVFHFELLRYAAEVDLPQRFMRELSAVVGKHAFAPEFAPLASRYSRMLKGKAEVSLLGIKYSFGPSEEEVDDTLDELDDVLKRIGRRLIIVIDDLDRLEPTAIKNVLFAVRRTFSLSQATYVLCYDAEVISTGDGNTADARLFLEKFITIKLSLFVDRASIINFLQRDWSDASNALKTVPSGTMLKLASVLSEMAELLKGGLAPSYMALLGDIRKVKRFVNAVLMMQIERAELAKTDFNRQDLINLMLMHLHFPGLFRQIYTEEAEGLSGSFSVLRSVERRQFVNSEQFSHILEGESAASSQFLLKQLFDVNVLQLNTFSNVREEILSSRACFNSDDHRNLEAYLKLIVRFVKPEPQETFIFFQRAVDRVRGGTAIATVLSESEFELSEKSHDQFWSLLVNQSYDFTDAVAEDAINTLVDILPKYPSMGYMSLRHGSIYSLARLLDSAGWGKANKKRPPNTSENVVEIADRIFGSGEFVGKALVRRLCENREVLGWNDVMLFRLVCSADRGGQLYNLQAALIAHVDIAAATTGLTSALALKGMRELSQYVFDLFKRTYIQSGRNFYAEVDAAPDELFLGSGPMVGASASPTGQEILASRGGVKSFVIYQLANSVGATGSGVGCGYYDEYGDTDGHGIAMAMNRYVFDICFDPKEESNVLHFADHCLSHLSNGFFSGEDVDGFVATKNGLPGGFDPAELAKYWRSYRDAILAMNLHELDRVVATSNYVKTYREGLPQVFAVLDELSK